MTDHSEFPWGPQYEPGLLTPFGVIGWVVAVILGGALIVSLFGRKIWRSPTASLDAIHKDILVAARYALGQPYYASPGAANRLRSTIRHHLGAVQSVGAGLTTQLKALDAALGEDEEREHDAKHKGGHGDKGSATSTQIAGSSIIVNVGAGAEKADGHQGGHADHGPAGHDDQDARPLSLADQLVAVEKAVRAFEAWWSNKPVRIAELSGAKNDLTKTIKPDPILSDLVTAQATPAPKKPRPHIFHFLEEKK